MKKEYAEKEQECKNAKDKIDLCNKKIEKLIEGKLILEEQLYSIAEEKENVKLQIAKEDESIAHSFIEKNQ